MASATPWLDGVEGPAVDIITSDADAIRVAAGPGTGKTFALMRRVARLLAQGAEPSRILVVTFTRTAARDLVDNLRDLGVDGARDVRAGTLHSYCFSVLSRERVLEATSRHPRPLLKHEVRVLQADLQQQHGFGIRVSKDLLAAFDAAWARLQHDTPGWPADAQERAFHAALLEWLRFHQGMLIGELVPEMRAYLRDNPGAAEHSAFDHVLVDEYQDLNRADQDLIDMLAAHGRLLVIGDEDQSIYTQLRYSQPEGIRYFATGRPGADDVPLAECRRCPTSVVAVANHLIAHNLNREPRALDPRPGNPPGEFQIVQWQTIEQEAEGLTRSIIAAIQRGDVEPREVLVLAPRRTVAYPIRDLLRQAGIPAHSFFSEEALDSAAAQERYTLLNLLAKPGDRVALRTWVSFGHNGHAAAGYARLQGHCGNTGVDLRSALEELRDGTLRITHTAHIVGRMQHLRGEVGHMTGLIGRDLVNALFPDGDEDLALVRSLAIQAVEEKGEDVEAAELFEDLRIRITQPELPEEGDFVRIMSLHKSKGLTAKLVVVAGAVEGWVPTVDLRGGARETDVVEEQRRLFYVALTRPTRRLILSTFLRMPLAIAHRMQVRITRRTASRATCVASRFFRELGPDAPRPVGGDATTTL
jgi:DNA helicase II / ATP-dependent DNA helicase PcrA